jgi:hypothetical protein
MHLSKANSLMQTLMSGFEYLHIISNYIKKNGMLGEKNIIKKIRKLRQSNRYKPIMDRFIFT